MSVESILARSIVVEQGKDHSRRPMIAVYGCYFPDPTKAKYDQLMMYASVDIDETKL